MMIQLIKRHCGRDPQSPANHSTFNHEIAAQGRNDDTVLRRTRLPLLKGLMEAVIPNAVRNLILILAMSLSLSSCDDFLTTTPTGTLFPDNYYQTAKEVEAALIGVYDIVGSHTLYGGTYSTSFGNDADESYYFRSTYTYGPIIYTHTSSDATVAGIWTTLYEGISRANLLLYKLKEAKDMDEAFIGRIRGETLFLRAYFYFLLVQTWGGVPLVLEPTISLDNLSVPRASVAEVYAQILKDMEEAEKQVLPISEIGHGGKVSKSAIRGILARVCLHAAGSPLNDKTKYKDARAWAKKVMEDPEFTHELNPSYRQVFINYAQDLYDIKESIWEAEFWGNRSDSYTETGLIGGLNGIQNNEDPDIGVARGFYAATGCFYDMYEPADTLRRDWNIAPFKYSSTPDPANPGKYITEKIPVDPLSKWIRYQGKYRREYETLLPKAAHETPINFPLLRYSDVLLMYAEAENELAKGPTGASYKAINLVRRRAFGKLLPDAQNINQYDLSGLDYNGFRNAIMEERSKELCFESLRKYDLVRWGKFVTRMNEVAEIIIDDIANLPSANRPSAYCEQAFRNVTQKNVLQPIPAKELSLNPLLVQNPMW